MRCNHCTVLVLIELNAQIVKPLNSLRRIANQLCKQLALCRIVTAAESVHKVDSRRIVRLIGSLNTALCHHGVCVADTQLGNNHGFCARLIGFDSRGRARAAAADNQHVNVILYVA